MKINLLINSINQSLFRDFFTNLPDDFSCISTSNLWDDIKGHFKIFEPDAFVCVVEDDVSVYKSIFKNIKGSLIFSKIPIIVITVDEIYQSFSLDDMEYMDLVLCRPITIANIYFKIQSFIEDKRAEEERIRKEQEAERIRKEQEAEELAKSALKNEKKNILVVDDDKNVLRILKSLLDDKSATFVRPSAYTTPLEGDYEFKIIQLRGANTAYGDDVVTNYSFGKAEYDPTAPGFSVDFSGWDTESSFKSSRDMNGFTTDRCATKVAEWEGQYSKALMFGLFGVNTGAENNDDKCAKLFYTISIIEDQTMMRTIVI